MCDPRRAATGWIAVVALFALTGCGEKPAAAPATAPAAVAVERRLPIAADFQTLAVLAPGRPTSVAVDVDGAIYYCQQSRDGKDLLMTLAGGAVPRPCGLSTDRIALALGAAGTRGNIHSIACTGRDLYFYFSGGLGKSSQLALGVYTPRNDQLRILARTAQLGESSGMGQSVPLAEGTVVATPGRVWLWLRHLDRASIVHFEPGKTGTSGEISLARTFSLVRSELEEIPLNRDAYHVSAGGSAGELLVTDAYGGGVWKVDLAGKALLQRSLVGMPSNISNGVIGDGGIVFFAAESDPILPRMASRAETPIIDANYPAFVWVRNGGAHVIPRERISAAPGWPVYAARLDPLLGDPSTLSYLAYDRTSGELIRIRFR